MSHETFEAKKNFVTRELSRCICAAHPDVKSLDYQLKDYPEGGLCETVIVRFLDGYIKRVCVSGDSMHAMISDVNYAME